MPNREIAGKSGIVEGAERRPREVGESDEVFTPSFGGYIRSLRQRLGYSSLSDCSRAIGIPEPTLSRVENGRYIPTRGSVDRLVQAFGADPDEAYMLAGYWPPSIPRDTALLNELHERYAGTNRSPYTQNTQSLPSELEMLTAEDIRRLRGSLSQEDFARKWGVSQSTISTWETGRVKPTSRRKKNQLNASSREEIVVYEP